MFFSFLGAAFSLLPAIFKDSENSFLKHGSKTISALTLSYAANRDTTASIVFASGNLADNLTGVDNHPISNSLFAYDTNRKIQSLFGHNSRNVDGISVLAGSIASQGLNFDLVRDFENYSEKTYESLTGLAEALPNQKVKVLSSIVLASAAQIGIEFAVQRWCNGFWSTSNSFLDSYNRSQLEDGNFRPMNDSEKNNHKSDYLEFIKYGLVKFFTTRIVEGAWHQYCLPLLTRSIASDVRKEAMENLFDNVVCRELSKDPSLKQSLDLSLNGINYNISGSIGRVSQYYKDMFFLGETFKQLNDAAPGVSNFVFGLSSLFNGFYNLIDQKQKSFYDDKFAAESSLSNKLGDTISNMQSIRAKEIQGDISADLSCAAESNDHFQHQQSIRNFFSNAYWKVNGAVNNSFFCLLLYKLVMCQSVSWEGLNQVFFKTNTLEQLCNNMSDSYSVDENLVSIKRVRDMIEKFKELKNHNPDYKHGKSEIEYDPNLTIKHLHIKFDESTVLGVKEPLVFTPGIYAMVAPSGTGKSTILEALKLGREAIADIVGDVTLPSTGEVLMFTQNDFIASGNMTLLQLLASPITPSPEVRVSVEAFLNSLKSSHEQADTIARLIERFDEERSDWSKVLSGGEKKIVQLCNFFTKASHENTAAIFLDESLNGMDPKLTVQVMKQIKNNFGDKIVLVVTHQHSMQNDLYSQEEGINFFDKMLALEGNHLSVSDY